jgi:hypothetical protein
MLQLPVAAGQLVVVVLLLLLLLLLQAGPLVRFLLAVWV